MADDRVMQTADSGVDAAEVTVGRPQRATHMATSGPLKLKGDLAKNWREWRQLWSAYEVAAGLIEASMQYRLATFITCIGFGALRIYNALPFANEAVKQQMDTVLQ